MTTTRALPWAQTPSPEPESTTGPLRALEQAGAQWEQPYRGEVPPHLLSFAAAVVGEIHRHGGPAMRLRSQAEEGLVLEWTEAGAQRAVTLEPSGQWHGDVGRLAQLYHGEGTV